MSPEKALESRLDEICSNCPVNGNGYRNDSPSIDTKNVDNCRMEYFGQLLQSFVGKPGDDETRKLYSLLKKCEECPSRKVGVADLPGGGNEVDNK
jgi:hypothetical protein